MYQATWGKIAKTAIFILTAVRTWTLRGEIRFKTQWHRSPVNRGSPLSSWLTGTPPPLCVPFNSTCDLGFPVRQGQSYPRYTSSYWFEERRFSLSVLHVQQTTCSSHIPLTPRTTVLDKLTTEQKAFITLFTKAFVLSNLNTVYVLKPRYFFYFNTNLFSHVHLVVPIDLSSVFPSKISLCMHFSSYHACYVPVLSYLPWTHYRNNRTSLRIVYIMNRLVMHFPLSFCHFCLLRSTFSL